jgi:hypothetical protein
MRAVESPIRWLAEPVEANLPLAFRLRFYALSVGLVLASVPFLHLYLEVDLTAWELTVHALDISLGVVLLLGVAECGISLWQRGFDWDFEIARHWLLGWIGTAVLVVFWLQAAFHDWLPMTEEIRHKHVDAGYTDMTLRVVPLMGLIGYLVVQRFRGQMLRRELEELRALNRQLAERDAPSPTRGGACVVFRHEGTDVELDPTQIQRVQAEENYCRIHLVDASGEARSLLVRTTLSETLEKLPGDDFLQVHRSHVVSARHVAGLTRTGRQSEVQLASGARVPVSRSRASDVQSRLQELLAASR